MKKILMIGAGFLQDFVIQKAKSMGYFVLTVDANPNAIGFKHADKYSVIDIKDEKACLNFAKYENIDGVLTAATDYGVLTASYIADSMGLPGLNYEAAKLIKNKFLVHKVLYKNSYSRRNVYEVGKKTDLNKIMDNIHYPVIVKPCDGSGSRGISRVDEKKDLYNACKVAMMHSDSNKVQIEPFIFGDEFGVESFVINGESHILAILKKYMTKPPYYAELGHSLPSGLSKQLEKKVKIYAKNVIETLGINYGSVNIDLLITESDEIHIIDIGARMGGNMIGSIIVPYGTGIDYVGNIIRASVNDPLDWSLGEKSAVASKILAFQGGIVKSLPEIEYNSKYIQIFHNLKVGDIVNKYRTNLDGRGYVIVRSDKVDVAENIASNILEDIKKCIVKE